ncbi:MAG: hypothetical protein GXN97_01485 [Aquificae bacterium]|nr:hypothetical protein [Aquificota bacterium]
MSEKRPRGAKKDIFKRIEQILEEASQGIRTNELVKRLMQEFDVKEGSLWNYITEFKGKNKDKIENPDRGLLILKKHYENTEKNKAASISASYNDRGRIREEDFYRSFADYLVNDLQECTAAIPLGGNQFRDKWGTPDVLGVYKFTDIDPIKPPPELISAEIKIDENQLITAFGQACAYKLFSHKVYLVIPNSASNIDISRIESLCLRFGIGLILFNKEDPENPDYFIRTRAVKSEPDYFYLNEYLRRLNKEQIKTLFG